jgi:hypothetical protein
MMPRPVMPTRILLVIALFTAAAMDSGRLGTNPPVLQHYVCLRADPTPVIDGRLDDPAWAAVPWTRAFVDIEGETQPAPPLRTRAKLLWDDRYFYVAAELEEPHVWATLTERDSVIFQDNDFEVFIDPDGDTHEYYELEINAKGTVWDLFLVRPYRDGGPPLHGWDIKGLQSAVSVDGTINDASDRDRGWTVELALPWSALAEAAPGRRGPRPNEYWRVNFSRVEWDTVVVAGRYGKVIDPGTGRPRPEHNWVWSEQGAIDMHRPERWGIVQFSDVRAGGGPVAFVEPPDESVRWALRQVYDAERAYFRAHHGYAATIEALGLGSPDWTAPEGFALDATSDRFEARAAAREPGALWHIREDGKLWMTR